MRSALFAEAMLVVVPTEVMTLSVHPALMPTGRMMVMPELFMIHPMLQPYVFVIWLEQVTMIGIGVCRSSNGQSNRCNRRNSGNER
jgi:hypothetical protein